MTELNDNVYKIAEKSPFTFLLVGIDSTKFHAYERQGIVEQVKQPVTIAFKSLADSFEKPYAPGKGELDLCDWEKIGRPEQLHLILTSLLDFVASNNGNLPQLNSEEDAQTLVDLVKKTNDQRKAIDEEGVLKVDEVDEAIVRDVSRYARAQVTPLSSFWGGIIAQEIVKFTGKYTPLRQWLHHETFEALPSKDTQVTR